MGIVTVKTLILMDGVSYYENNYVISVHPLKHPFSPCEERTHYI